VPAGRVEQMVVAGALQGEIVEGRWPAVENPTDMMCLAPFGWAITAGEPAVPVADHQGVEQVGGDGAGGGPVVQDAGPARHEHAVHAGVTEQSLHGRAVEDRPVEQSALSTALQSSNVVTTLRCGRWRPPRRSC
jgi:hypothetical protein